MLVLYDLIRHAKPCIPLEYPLSNLCPAIQTSKELLLKIEKDG
jgi:hypothetical protein